LVTVRPGEQTNMCRLTSTFRIQSTNSQGLWTRR
jgi:hypothetical protein